MQLIQTEKKTYEVCSTFKDILKLITKTSLSGFKEWPMHV